MQKMHVLAVDDDSDDLEIFCEAVHRIDPEIECVVAENGDEALKYLNQNAVGLPNIIFLDINMPRMNGRECLSIIKANPAFNDITVVMYSTTQSQAEIVSYQNMGALFLRKPPSLGELIHSLKEMLQ